jgi:hypothetical protein
MASKLMLMLLLLLLLLLELTALEKALKRARIANEHERRHALAARHISMGVWGSHVKVHTCRPREAKWRNNTWNTAELEKRKE